MVAYNFQERFAPAVESGEKRQTIWGPRKRHARPGEPVQLYRGLRTVGARKLVDPDPICTVSKRIRINEQGIQIAGWEGLTLPNKFAVLDGFADFADMKKWFRETHGLPFMGQLIMWEPSPTQGAPDV